MLAPQQVPKTSQGHVTPHSKRTELLTAKCPQTLIPAAAQQGKGDKPGTAKPSVRVSTLGVRKQRPVSIPLPIPKAVCLHGCLPPSSVQRNTGDPREGELNGQGRLFVARCGRSRRSLDPALLGDLSTIQGCAMESLVALWEDLSATAEPVCLDFQIMPYYSGTTPALRSKGLERSSRERKDGRRAGIDFRQSRQYVRERKERDPVQPETSDS